MPNQPRTQHRSVRVGDEDWSDLEAAAAVVGADRAKIINQLIRWYLRRPGATLPHRPEGAAWGQDGDTRRGTNRSDAEPSGTGNAP